MNEIRDINEKYIMKCPQEQIIKQDYINNYLIPSSQIDFRRDHGVTERKTDMESGKSIDTTVSHVICHALGVIVMYLPPVARSHKYKGKVPVN